MAPTEPQSLIVWVVAHGHLALLVTDAEHLASCFIRMVPCCAGQQARLMLLPLVWQVGPPVSPLTVQAAKGCSSEDLNPFI